MDLNLSPNLFLEINELNRFKKSLRENGYQLALKYLSKSFVLLGQPNVENGQRALLNHVSKTSSS